ncbi:hypothetical protein [Bacillus massiliglaciei]|uniref:hypothetical protein n=1 Tax=Bacillus massiliglaciei TaxID=1816693 RepID=UPI000DA60FB7|nr:hypothetical protein [Bacillus massiliglaciei]
MSHVINHLFQKAQSAISQTAEYVKEKLAEAAGTSETIPEIVRMIETDPETTVQKQQLLGLEFTFYHLEKSGINYYLETKGSYILQLDIHSAGHEILAYRSYRDQKKLGSSVRIPN